MAPELKSSAATSLKKVMAVAVFLMGKGFSASKCKTEVKLATARIKLLRNRREAHIRQMKKDIALLLSSGQESTARIRVEHVIREQNIMAANEIIELFCELVVVRLSIIAKQRDCPADLKEGISSLIFAAPRCSEIPELSRIRDIFEKKYGKDFVSAAMELRPNSGVNKTLIEKLSVRTPLGEAKLEVMKKIAKEHQIQWDPIESEQELLKPSEERINGPTSFDTVSTTPETYTTASQDPPLKAPARRASTEKEHGNRQLPHSISAAQAAAELAEKAVAVAAAAADFAKQASLHANNNKVNLRSPVDNDAHDHQPYGGNDHAPFKGNNINDNAPQHCISNSATTRDFDDSYHNPDLPKVRSMNSDTANSPDFGMYKDCVSSDDDMSSKHPRRRNHHRREIHNQRSSNSNIKFDDSDGLESDCDEGRPNRSSRLSSSEKCYSQREQSDEMETTHQQNTSSQVHPKLPDYESFAARFEALKNRRFS